MKREIGQNARIEITQSGSGQLMVRGELTFATARLARDIGERALAGSAADRIVMDCAGVTRADSAGLAVLLDWLAWGRRRKRVVQLDNLPESLVAIARISELDGLLTAAG